MNSHVPFDSNSMSWGIPQCGGNSSNDPLVDKMIGNAYHVVRTVYCNLGNLKLIYDFLMQYGMVLGVQSEEELKAMTTSATYARIYDKTPAGDRQVTDYLYVEGDRTGILPNEPTATGSWIKVATSNSGGGSGYGSNDGGYIPWIYNSGSANGGETTIRIPDETAGAPFMIVNGDWQTDGYDFAYDPYTFTITFTTPLEPGDFVVVMRTGVPATPDNPNVSDWVTINWLYNQGAAVGGEQVIDIPYSFQSVPAVFKNGLRFYKGLAAESYTIDADNNRIILTEPLATNDRLIIQLGGEARVLEVVDHTIQEVARAANVKDSEVIISTDTTQVLNNKKIIFDVTTQHSYGLPALPTNVYIKSVNDGKLTYNPGSVEVTLMQVPNNAVDALKADLSAENGINMIGGGLHAGMAEDTLAYNTITINGETYTLEPSLTGLPDGFSVNAGSLCISLAGNTYTHVRNGDFISWPGSYLANLTDAKQSLEAVMGYGMGVDLCGHAVPVSTLEVTANIKNGELVAIGDVGSFIVINSASAEHILVNCNGKAVRRAVHLKMNANNPRFVHSEVFNSTGATNANGVFVDANGIKNFLVSDVTVRNLTSIANGSQGDADGPCRGVIVGSALDPTPTAATVSTGLIENIRIRDLAPFEDCDGVVVQVYDSASTMLSTKNIIVDGVYTYNVLKRAVKIQSNDVTVRNVNAVCDSASDAMYAIVSLYGDNGLAENITGRGKISNGIDCAYGFNHVNNLYLKTERTGSDTLSGIGAGLLINSGQVSARNIHSEGAEYVIAIREALGNTPYVKIDGITGQGYSGVVRFQIRAANSIGSVYLSDISATSSSNSKGSVSVDFTSGALGYLNVTGVKRLSQPYTGPDINLAGQVTKAYFNDCVFNTGSSTIGINMVTGKLFVNGVVSNKTVAVGANQTSEAYIANVNGVVKLENTTNTTLITAKAPTQVGTNTGLKQVSYV